MKPLVDDRYDLGHVVSHAGVEDAGGHGRRRAPRCCGSRAATTRSAIDEVQFFDDGIVGAIDELVDRGSRVVVSGPRAGLPGAAVRLDADAALHRRFVDKLQAVCHRCGGPATLTQRLLDGQPAPFAGATVQIGALDSYEARCRVCFEPGDDAAAVA